MRTKTTCMHAMRICVCGNRYETIFYMYIPCRGGGYLSTSNAKKTFVFVYLFVLVFTV